MAEGLPLEAWGAFEDLGKGIGGVLVRVTGQDIEGLDLAHHVEPAAHGCPGGGPPSFDCERQLGGPQQRQTQNLDE